MKEIIKIVGVSLGSVIVAVGVFLIGQGTAMQDNFGSVSVSSEYHATSTAANSVFGATITNDTLVVSGPGTLGSVVITGANTGVINIYNATTTNVSQRTGNTATSTILLASIPASAAAGTYTFDLLFTDGLFVDLNGGIMPTTTITFRYR